MPHAETLTPYKLKRITTETLRNALRLHADALLLYSYNSYPSAFQLSILSLEELAKAKSVAHRSLQQPDERRGRRLRHGCVLGTEVARQYALASLETGGVHRTRRARVFIEAPSSPGLTNPASNHVVSTLR